MYIELEPFSDVTSQAALKKGGVRARGRHTLVTVALLTPPTATPQRDRASNSWQDEQTALDNALAQMASQRMLDDYMQRRKQREQRRVRMMHQMHARSGGEGE